MLLTRLPLLLRGARLACVKPAASVRSEPGSNSHVEKMIYGLLSRLNRREPSVSIRKQKCLLSKRDRHVSCRTSLPASPRAHAAHVSLSHYAIVKKPTNRHQRQQPVLAANQSPKAQSTAPSNPQKRTFKKSQSNRHLRAIRNQLKGNSLSPPAARRPRW